MKKLLFSLLFTASFGLNAQQKHPIDQKAYDALQDAVTTAAMMDAQNIALDGWTQLMNVTLKALKSITQPGTYAVLEQSQTTWEKYRDAQFEVINRVYYAELQGTMWRPVAIGARTQLLRQRTEVLQDIYLELAAQQGELYDLLPDTWESNSAAYRPPLLIRDDLTIYGLEGEQMVEFGFYYLSDDCNGKKDEKGRKAMTIYEFVADEARCFFVEMKDDNQLELYGAPGNDQFRSYNRKK